MITAQSLAYNFTNEGGVCDTFRLLKNIMGLWLVQECRREWARAGEDYDYSALTQMAAAAAVAGHLVDLQFGFSLTGTSSVFWLLLGLAVGLDVASTASERTTQSAARRGRGSRSPDGPAARPR